MNTAKTVQIQGSTGSIGTQAISIIKEHPEKFKVRTLTAKSQWPLLALQARELNVEHIVIEDETFYQPLKDTLRDTNVKIYAGRKALIDIAAEKYDVTVSGILGIAALEPTLAAIKNSKVIGLANKESIICAGEIMLKAAAQHNTKIIPVDSEHSAIFQVLDTTQVDKINRITITASGGPFRTKTTAEMENITPEQAIKHPNWRMGGKISVDCATLINKGLELIEATRLFMLPASQISIVVHPESIIHGLINYKDGSTLAQLSIPNMRTPIAYSLFYPNRLELMHKELDLAELGKLHFEPPDYTRFPLLKLTIEIATKSQSEIIALNVANEVAVNAFLMGKIKFLDIYQVVSNALDKFQPVNVANLEDVVEVSDKIANFVSKQLI